MTSEEIVKSLRVCAGGITCEGCAQLEPLAAPGCHQLLAGEAADLIEWLEKEKAALIEAANPKKLCEICKNDSYCFDARCGGNRCDDCWQYRDCPCADCLSHPKWERKGLESEQ